MRSRANYGTKLNHVLKQCSSDYAVIRSHYDAELSEYLRHSWRTIFTAIREYNNYPEECKRRQRIPRPEEDGFSRWRNNKDRGERKQQISDEFTKGRSLKSFPWYVLGFPPAYLTRHAARMKLRLQVLHSSVKNI